MSAAKTLDPGFPVVVLKRIEDIKGVNIQFKELTNILTAQRINVSSIINDHAKKIDDIVLRVWMGV